MLCFASLAGTVGCAALRFKHLYVFRKCTFLEAPFTRQRSTQKRKSVSFTFSKIQGFAQQRSENDPRLHGKAETIENAVL